MRERFEVGLHEREYVVMDRNALRLEDMVVASYESRTVAQLDADHRNAFLPGPIASDEEQQ